MRILRLLLLTVALTASVAGVLSTQLRPIAAAPMVSPSAALATKSVLATRPVAQDEARAQRIFGQLAEKYRLLDDVTITMGVTPNDEEAVAYYTDGQIVINRAHSVSVDEILAHEVWHIIDWRDNGCIDWAEDLPPNNSDAYLKR